MKTKAAPKFFFLDPFAYGEIGINDVKDLMGVPATEVLLFLPTFHSYCFVKCAKDVGALKAFLEAFTERGCADYADINDFNESIRQRLLKYVGLKYVRSIGLDDGSKKNALFYLTKHITGMLLMNKLIWNVAQDGITVKAKREPTLFNLSTISGNFDRIRQVVRDHIREKKRMSNVEIVEFVAQNGFATTYANDVLKGMKKEGLITVKYKSKRNDKTRGFYVADNNWNDDLATIIYKE